MTTFLPLVALLLAVIGFVLGRPPEAFERPALSRYIAPFLILIFGVLASNKLADAGVRLSVSVGLALGVVMVTVATALPRRKDAESAFMSLGVAGVGLLLWQWPDQIKWAGLAYVAGLGFAAIAAGEEVASLTAVGGSVVALATILGRYSSDTPAYTHTGVAIGLGVCLLGVVRQAAIRFLPNSGVWIAIGVRLLGLGLAYLIGSRYLGLHDAWVSMALAVAAGVAVWAATPSDEVTEPGRAVVATVIWIGLGTLTFGLARGYGMALALALAAGLHLVLGERRALASCGPLLGLVIYRVFREAHLDAWKALDLGQHYALIGLAIGAALPLLPERWWATKPANPWLQSAGGVLWTVLWVGAPFLAALLLGPKGVVGFVVGVGFSSLFSATGAAPTLLPLAAAAAAGGVATLTYGWLQALTDLTRDEKLHWVLIAVIPLVLVGLILTLIGFKKPASDVAVATV